MTLVVLPVVVEEAVPVAHAQLEPPNQQTIAASSANDQKTGPQNIHCQLSDSMLVDLFARFGDLQFLTHHHHKEERTLE